MTDELPQILEQLLRHGGGMQSLPPGLVWLFGLVSGGFVIVLALRLANWRLRRSFEAVARLQGFEVRADSAGSEIEALYEFRFRGRSYHGSGRVPLSALLPGDGLAWIAPHEYLDVPVLRFCDEVYVGEEAIEHALLQLQSTVRVRFLSADPTRNSPVVEDLLPERRT